VTIFSWILVTGRAAIHSADFELRKASAMAAGGRKLQILEQDGVHMKFRLTGVDSSVANALRRVIIAEVCVDMRQMLPHHFQHLCRCQLWRLTQ
jgi:hypothetical protein